MENIAPVDRSDPYPCSHDTFGSKRVHITIRVILDNLGTSRQFLNLSCHLKEVLWLL